MLVTGSVTVLVSLLVRVLVAVWTLLVVAVVVEVSVSVALVVSRGDRVAAKAMPPPDRTRAMVPAETVAVRRKDLLDGTLAVICRSPVSRPARTRAFTLGNEPVRSRLRHGRENFARVRRSCRPARMPREQVEVSQVSTLRSQAGDQTTVIRPAAVLPEAAARAVLAALERLDVAHGGIWNASPGVWQRYDRPWDGDAGSTGHALLVGTIAAVYGTPSRYEITIYRATVTQHGLGNGWTVEALCDDALQHAGLTLERCPRAALVSPPTPDPFRRRRGPDF